MPLTIQNNVIERQARLLAKDARQTDPCITKFYWFPDDTEVHLVEVATNMLPAMSDEIEPFYFPPAPESGMPALSGVALILDGEQHKLRPPKGWGSWEDAKELNLDSE